MSGKCRKEFLMLENVNKSRGKRINTLIISFLIDFFLRYKFSLTQSEIP